jgi:ribosomal protein S18 acetylase RimI-like enzyme
MGADISIANLSADDVARRIGELGALLHACVAAGASVNFVQPFTPADSEAFWRDKVLPAVRGGTRIVLVAERAGRIAGSVQLGIDTPPNQPHRAEVTKLLVHPDIRRQGIAKAMMAALERLAGEMGRRLITLDTRTGDNAEPLYAALGYVTVGVIPGYSRDPYGSERLDATTIMYKSL